MHRPEGVVGDDEVGVGLDRARQQVHCGLVGLLRPALERHRATCEKLEGAWRPRGQRRALDLRGLGRRERHLECPRERNREPHDLREQLALRCRDRLEEHDLTTRPLDLQKPCLDHELRGSPRERAEQHGLGAHRAGRLA